MKQAVVLVHGLFRSSSDMTFLHQYLKKQGYVVFCPDFPTTLGSLVECSKILSIFMSSLNLAPGDKLHLIGHSMGGLIIRHCLASRTINPLGRCVLIATPNQGTFLADAASKFLGHWPINPFSSLASLRTSADPIAKPVNSPPPDIGVIAGNHSNLLLGRLLKSQNDGRVEVQATKFDEMKDFIVLPFGHHDIHHHHKTASLVDFFLKNGTF